MRINHRAFDLFMGLLFIVGMLALWLVFAPQQIGGSAAYVIVHGTSMEPGLKEGDFVVMRRSAVYQVGDVVAYRDAQMDINVIHRIIGQDQEHLLLKGDHNTWVDAARPTQQDVIGTLWIFIPKFGWAVEWLREPLHLAGISGLLGGMLMAGMLVKQPKNKKNGGNKLPIAGGSLEIALLVCGFFALASLALSIYGFSLPLLRPADRIQYQHSGSFSYTANGTNGIYDASTVSSGEPIFPKLTCQLGLAFNYNLLGGDPKAINGFQQLDARIMDEASGWRRTLSLTSRAAFQGSSFVSNASIDLCQVESLVANLELQTGFHPSTYTMAVVAQVWTLGDLAGQNLTDSFTSTLTFRFDRQHFYLADQKDTIAGPLSFTQAGSVASNLAEETPFNFLGITLTVRHLRVLAMIALICFLGGFMIAGFSYYHLAMSSRHSLISAKYGSAIVDFYDRGLEKISPVIEVASIDHLGKIAERNNAVILHSALNRHASVHFYFVQANGTTYRYVTGDQMKSARGKPA